MNYYLLILALLFQFSCHTSAQQMKAERKIFQKSTVIIKSPTTYLKRKTEKGEYDPKPQFVLIDEKSGKYELRWIGDDGKEKVINYQRADALEALVEARVEKETGGQFVYKYLLRNLPASPTYLSSFTVQTFAGDVKVTKLDGVYIGDMTTSLKGFNEGVWWHYGILGDNLLKIDPGKTIELSLVSAALPGIVGCRATAGELTLKGAGEHMPSELEASMPGYEEWAKGYTIGPVERLAALGRSERAKYVLENLPKFQDAGWIGSEAAKKYEAILKMKDLATALSEAEKDHENGVVTSEVYHIIEGLSR